MPYFLGRLASLVLSLIAASVVIFLVIEVIPGDPAQFMLGLNADAQTIAALRAQMGLDQPLLLRYVGWVLGMLHGDFGISYTYRVPVTELVNARLGVSVPLAAFALLLTVLIAFPAGILAAARRNSRTDVVVMSTTQLGVAVPNFWFAMLLVLLGSSGSAAAAAAGAGSRMGRQRSAAAAGAGKLPAAGKYRQGCMRPTCCILGPRPGH